MEVKLKTHLIITDINDEYFVKWCGKLLDAKPLLKNGLPIFTIVGSCGRVELNTIDITLIERCAKRLSHPRGRSAFTTDSTCIYLQEEDGTEKLMGTVLHNRIKKYQPMYDPFEKINI